MKAHFLDCPILSERTCCILSLLIYNDANKNALAAAGGIPVLCRFRTLPPSLSLIFCHIPTPTRILQYIIFFPEISLLLALTLMLDIHTYFHRQIILQILKKNIQVTVLSKSCCWILERLSVLSNHKTAITAGMIAVMSVAKNHHSPDQILLNKRLEEFYSRLL